MTLSWNFDYQRILPSDWITGTTGHAKSKVVASNATVAWWLIRYKKTKISIDSFQRYWWSEIPRSNQNWSWMVTSLGDLPPCTKSKILINSFQRYWWLKNHAIWLVQNILNHNWRTRFSQTCYFRQIKRTLLCIIFRVQKETLNAINFWKKPKNPFLIFQTNLALPVFVPWDTLTSCNVSEKFYESFLRKTDHWRTDQLIEAVSQHPFHIKFKSMSSFKPSWSLYFLNEKKSPKSFTT